jgi:hypothetical protein
MGGLEVLVDRRHVSVYIQIHTLTSKLFLATLSKIFMPTALPSALAHLGTPPPAYRDLQRQLRHTSWICQGTLVARPLIRRVAGRKVKKGPYYLWTCKVKGRTVCLALSKTQYRLLAQAIANHRRLHQILERMQAFSLKFILQNTPGVKKRK